MFIPGSRVIYVKTPSDHSNATELFQRIVLYEINKSMQKTEVKCFVHLLECCHPRRIQNYVTS